MLGLITRISYALKVHTDKLKLLVVVNHMFRRTDVSTWPSPLDRTWHADN